MPTESGITFEDPPTEDRGRHDWEAIAADLRAHPGEWAKIFERDKTTFVSAFYQGLKALPREEFEARTSNTERGVTEAEAEALGIEPQPRTCTLHMRYIGPTKEST